MHTTLDAHYGPPLRPSQSFCPRCAGKCTLRGASVNSAGWPKGVSDLFGIGSRWRFVGGVRQVYASESNPQADVTPVPTQKENSPNRDWAQTQPLRGRSGLVTGAAHGIGRSIALRLAQLGANVGLNYWSSEEAARATAKEIEATGRQALLLQGDVGSEEDVRRVVSAAHQQFGTLDFLVNNAGGAGGAKTDSPIDVAVFEDWTRVLASNLNATFLCTRYVSPFMLEAKGGKIVNISSICGITGDCGPAYCASKAGILGLTRHSAVALAPFVQVNAILPGFVDSQPHDAKKVARITPGRTMGHPEDVADLTGYLIASPQRFLTGSCIVLDGSVTNGIIGRMMDWDEVLALEERRLGPM